MAFDAGEIIARARIDPSQFDKDLNKLKGDVKRFEEDGHRIRLQATMQDSDLTRARQQFARFDQQLYNDAVQRQRSGRGILAGMFGRVVGGAAGATLFGGLVGAGGAASSAGAEQAVRTEMNRLDQQLSRDAGIRARLSGLGGGGGASGGGGGGRGFFGNLLGGIGPNILGLGTRLTAGIGLGGSLLAALPALTGGVGALGVGVLGAGVIAKGASTLIGTQQSQGPLFNQAQAAGKAFKDALGSAATGLERPLRTLFSQVPALVHSIAGPLKDLFSGAGTLIGPFVHGLTDLAKEVLPGLSQAFRIVAPLMRPFLDGVGHLVGNLLPGLNSLLRAVRPALMVLEQILSMLGRDLGSMFRDFAPVVGASAVILKGLLSVLAAIFPIIGQVAAIFAKTLAPVFKVFAGIIKDLLPVLTTIGKVFAELAGAIIGDLAAAFGALAMLIKDISPSLNILAKVLGQVFKTMENAGVFAIFGNTLEQIVPVLARFINQIVGALAPALPAIVKAVGQLASALVQLLAAGLITLLKVATPVLVLVARLTTDLVLWLSKMHLLAPVLALVTTALLAGRIAMAALATASFVGSVATKAFAAAQAILSAAMDANPIVLVTLAIVALGVAAFELYRHWSTVWGFVKQIAADAWHFIYDGFGKFLLPLLGPAGLIALGAIELAQHWSTVWGAIKNTALDAWNFLQNDIWHPLKNVLLNDIPSWWSDAVSAIGNAWNKIEGVVTAPVRFVIDHVIDGLISVFDWISSKVGGPHIAAIHPFGLAEGGRIPGYGGGDRHLALLESGEAVVSKETTAAHAGELRRWGVPGMQGGGIVGDIGHALGGIFHDVTGAGKILAALATGNSVALVNAIKSIIPGGVGGAVGDLAQLLIDIPKTLITDAVKFLVGQFGGGGGPGMHGGHPLAGAGVFSQRQLEALWVEAGGPPGLAHLMAAIADAESGGRPNALNPSGASGLWQILGQIVPGNIFNPFVNAENAVAKWRTQGLGAWVTYTSGAYKQFLDQGGWLLPGVTASINQTGMREAVLTPSQSQAFTALARYAEGNMSRGSAWGKHQIAEVINLMLPEGTTVAQAMTELVFRMKVAEQQGFAGVVP